VPQACHATPHTSSVTGGLAPASWQERPPTPLRSLRKLHGDPEASHLLRPAQATAIFAARSRAASSSAASTTAKPPRCSLDSMNGPSVNSGVPPGASTLNTGAASSSPPVKMKTPAAFISATSAPTALDFSRSSPAVRPGTHSSLKAMRYSVMSPPLPERPPADTLHLLHERRRPDPTPRQDLPAAVTARLLVPGRT
jgi:hypothetical protein